jgi:hypothetical protein
MIGRAEVAMARTVVAYATSVFVLAYAIQTWCAAAPPATNPGNAMPCGSSAHRQFDFWVGDWDVFDVERPAVVIAHARVQLILNDCVLHEVYQSLDGHKGESFTIYDATRDIWHQSWVNDHGYLLTIEGRLQGGSMILHGIDHLPNGEPRRVRGEWRSQEHGVREVAARSTDGGVTWVPWFDLLFRPHKPTP